MNEDTIRAALRGENQDGSWFGTEAHAIAMLVKVAKGVAWSREDDTAMPSVESAQHALDVARQIAEKGDREALELRDMAAFDDPCALGHE